MYLDYSVLIINISNSEQSFIVCLWCVCVCVNGVAHHQSYIRPLEEGPYKTLW
jgi:hypothetical protein